MADKIVIRGILCLVLVLQVKSQSFSMGLDGDKNESMGNDRLILQRWQKTESTIKAGINAGIKAILPKIMGSLGKVNISSTCTKDVLHFIAGMKNLRAWAFKILDASGKTFDGLLSGTMSSLGDFDQCLDTEAINERRGRNYGKVMFRGKYCVVEISPLMPTKRHYYKIGDVLEELKNLTKERTFMAEIVQSAYLFHFLSLRLGICVPSGCSRTDIQHIARSLRDFSWLVNIKRCEIKEDNEVTPVMVTVMILYSIFGLSLVLGTLVDLIHHYRGRKIDHRALQVICSFSLMANFKKLVDTESAFDPMRFLHGVRFLAISWIVLAHTYKNVNLQIFRGLRNIRDYPQDFAFQAVANAAVSVDTFFFMSGLLLCYATMKVVRDSKNSFHLGLYLLHRYIRLTPLYACVIAMIFLIPLLGSGPIWHDTVDPIISNCQQNWWTNLLFLNNFVNADRMCLLESWYVACDMQLYIYALVILLPLLRWPKIGILISTITILASVIIAAVITYIHNFPPTMLLIHPDEEQRTTYLTNLYFKPYPHAAPYCMGMLVGYLLATKSNVRLSMPMRVFGWIAAITSNMAVLYGVYGWNKGQEPTFWETMLYGGCHRVGWTLGLTWIVVCCFYGYGGVVNYILSWKAWIPLSRLTYAIYLIHPVVQMLCLGNIRMRVQTTHFFAVWMYFGHLLISVGVSFTGSILVEAPILSLEKIWLKTKLPQDQSTEKGKHLTNGVENEVFDCHESKVNNDILKNMTVSRL